MNLKLITCFFAVLLCLTPFTGNGQVVDYNIYQIQLGAFSKDVNLKKFKKLEDLGTITTNPIGNQERSDGLTRVFLGKFLGLEAAQKVMEIVKARGFEDAVYNVDSYNLNHSTGRYLIYTLQFGAHKKKYNIRKYKEFGEFILYQEGYYRVCYGLYASEDMPALRATIIPNIRKKRFKPFPRRFR